MSDENKDSKLSSDDLNKQIIGAIAKPYKGEQTSRWIKNMDDEALATEITNAAPSESLNLNSVALIDKLFTEFQRYAYEYQQSPATAGQHFAINVGTPKVNDAPSTPQYGQVPVLCQGHVSTTHWAMIFIGFVGKVQAFVVPVEYTVGFRPSQKEFAPFVEMKAVSEKNVTDWRIDGYPISSSLLPPLAKRFFGSLIKVEREEAKHTDVFVWDPSIRVEAAPMPRRMDESDGVQLLSDAVLQQEAQLKQKFQQASPAQYQSQSQSQQSQLVRQQQPRPQAQQDRPMPAGDGETDTVPQAFDRNNQIIQSALADFLDRMDLEVDRLTKIGTMTIQAQDMAGAQRTIIRSAKLKEMRDRVNDLSNEWNAVVSE
jgi:hypothetical protein